MTIQKKSLLSSLNTTKKAIVASNSGEAKPNVAAPVAARLNAKVTPRAAAKVVPRAVAKVVPRAAARISAHVKAIN